AVFVGERGGAVFVGVAFVDEGRSRHARAGMPSSASIVRCASGLGRLLPRRQALTLARVVPSKRASSAPLSGRSARSRWPSERQREGDVSRAADGFVDG